MSKSITLLPGDIIMTGTPGGVGVFREPPVFLKDCDVCVVRIAGVGQLANPVMA
jgi:2-keto-4-pentenoate hydratase/2-oxohepta-3-ene-1,7-dioic acid hydratase in catechol pathway